MRDKILNKTQPKASSLYYPHCNCGHITSVVLMWNQFSFINKKTSMYNTYFLTQNVCLPGKHNMITENTTNDNNKLISKGATSKFCVCKLISMPNTPAQKTKTISLTF